METGIPAELLETAKKLVCNDPGGQPPTPYDCNRAVSTAYYALFHCVAEQALLQFASNCSDEYREGIYRCLDHTQIRKRCNKIITADQNPHENIKAFSETFVEQQELRHLADYDRITDFSSAEAQLKIANAITAIEGFQQAPLEARADFMAGLLHKNR